MVGHCCGHSLLAISTTSLAVASLMKVTVAAAFSAPELATAPITLSLMKNFCSGLISFHRRRIVSSRRPRPKCLKEGLGLEVGTANERH